MEYYLVLYLVLDWALDLAILIGKRWAHHLVVLSGLLLGISKPK